LRTLSDSTLFNDSNASNPKRNELSKRMCATIAPDCDEKLQKESKHKSSFTRASDQYKKEVRFYWLVCEIYSCIFSILGW
jgi:hypothetical protein